MRGVEIMQIKKGKQRGENVINGIMEVENGQIEEEIQIKRN